MSVLVLTGDCRTTMPQHGPFDMIFADPPYGDTALSWDTKVRGWEAVALTSLKPSGSMWVFGSMRYFLDEGVPAGFRLAQDIVWEKANGTGFSSDRFKRVHEHAVQFYRADAAWSSVFNDVQKTPYSGPNKNVRRRLAERGQHYGDIGQAGYEDDGTRIMRSVIPAPSVRGGIHPTQKPVELLATLVRTSCPGGGVVGDFFAGSGAAGEACALAGRNYIGCELDPSMAQKARDRLDGHLFAGAPA